MAHGGKRPGAGRKPKADEIRLIEKLDEFIDQDAIFRKLDLLARSGDMAAMKLFFEYRFGKPRQQLEIEHSGAEDKPPLMITKTYEK